MQISRLPLGLAPAESLVKSGAHIPGGLKDVITSVSKHIAICFQILEKSCLSKHLEVIL
jgi:hypothetical protein